MIENQVNYEIVKFIDIIETYQINKKEVNTADFIIPIDKYFISGGTSKSIFIFDFLYKKYREIKGIEWVYNIFPSPKSNNNKDVLTAIGCTKDCIFLLKIKNSNNNDNLMIIDYSPENTFILCVNKQMFCCQENQLTIYSDIGSKILRSLNTVNHVFDKKLMKSAIKLNNIIIFKSNKIVSNGEDKLIFYLFFKWINFNA